MLEHLLIEDSIAIYVVGCLTQVEDLNEVPRSVLTPEDQNGAVCRGRYRSWCCSVQRG